MRRPPRLLAWLLLLLCAIGADGSLTLYLAYSANFAYDHGARPPGSGYHWTMQEVRLRP